MIKSSYIVFLMLFFMACSQKVHKDFAANRLVNNYDTHIINDSLQLYLKSPGDIHYTTDRKTLSKRIKQEGSTHRNALLYGKTVIGPHYEYFLILDNPSVLNYSLQENTILLDTILANHKVSLIGRNLDKNTSAFQVDLKNLFSSIQLGPGYRQDVSTVMDVVSGYQRSNRFLEAYERIKSFPAYDQDEEWLKLQMQLTYASFLENHPEYKELLKKFEPEGRKDSISQIITQHLIPESEVYTEIIAKAKLTNLVMVNENHIMPQHREFVHSLLPALKAIGYTYLALEAIGTDQDSLLNQEAGFPKLETGFYTKEQHFGNLLRYAKALGFKFVAYESYGSADRELGQALNLYEKTFGRDKDAKVLLLGGIDHILEQPTAEGKKWLGAVLQEKYAINPLTISQTHLNRYRKFSKERISLVEGKHFSGRLQSVDYHLLNNVSQPLLDEKGSNFRYTNLFPFPVQLSLFLAEEAEDEYDLGDKIPFHAIYLKPNEKTALRLPSKTLHLVLFDTNGKTIKHEVVNVSKQTKEHIEDTHTK